MFNSVVIATARHLMELLFELCFRSAELLKLGTLVASSQLAVEHRPLELLLSRAL